MLNVPHPQVYVANESDDSKTLNSSGLEHHIEIDKKHRWKTQPNGNFLRVSGIYIMIAVIHFYLESLRRSV